MTERALDVGENKAVRRAREAYAAKLKSTYRFDPGVEVLMGLENQPVSTIVWVERETIRANPWNPNVTAPPELKLLKTSILADGWTQPLVVAELPDPEPPILYELTDGEHRFLVSADPDVLAMTGGFVPVAITGMKSDEERMMSTVRHNRARGTHHVLAMADIVTTLVNSGVDAERVSVLLGMESEEIERMRDRGDMLKRGSEEEFHSGWVPR